VVACPAFLFAIWPILAGAFWLADGISDKRIGMSETEKSLRTAAWIAFVIGTALIISGALSFHNYRSLGRVPMGSTGRDAVVAITGTTGAGIVFFGYGLCLRRRLRRMRGRRID
jgi:hypothetical protein